MLSVINLALMAIKEVQSQSVEQIYYLAIKEFIKQ